MSGNNREASPKMPNTLPTIKRTSCPLCGSRDYSEQRVVDEHSIVVCRNCRFVYVNNPIDWSQSTNTSAAKKRQVRPRHQILANFARTIGAETVLEVGSGVGELGTKLTEQGFGYIGVEPDLPRALSCQEAGLDVRATPLEDLTLEYKVDLVVIDNVLEHVVDPVGLLKTSREFLKSDGHVAIVVPQRNDVRRVIPSWRKKHLWVPKVHVNYFTGASLRDTLTKGGFEAGYFPATTFRGTDSLARSLIGRLSSVGLFPFGLYMSGKSSG